MDSQQFGKNRSKPHMTAKTIKTFHGDLNHSMRALNHVRRSGIAKQ